MAGPIYALNLFNVADRNEYLAYSRRSSKEVQAHGGHVVALGRFREAVAGEIKPRAVMILVEFQSVRLQGRTPEGDRIMSALPPKADIGERERDVRFVPKADIAVSFDHIVSRHKEALRQSEAECLGGLEIEREIELRWLLDG